MYLRLDRQESRRLGSEGAWGFGGGGGRVRVQRNLYQAAPAGKEQRLAAGTAVQYRLKQRVDGKVAWVGSLRRLGPTTSLPAPTPNTTTCTRRSTTAPTGFLCASPNAKTSAWDLRDVDHGDVRAQPRSALRALLRTRGGRGS